MRVFIAVLVLIFSFQSWIKADDIRDFEIEGMSIGDSLLDHMSENEINKNIVEQQYKNDKFIAVLLFSSNQLVNLYDALYIDFKKDDKKFIIEALAGIIDYQKMPIDKCFEQKEKIVSELKSVMQNSSIQEDEIKHWRDTSGKSKVYRTSFEIKSYRFLPIEVSCFDWDKTMDYVDHLRVSIKSDEYNDWLKEATQ